MGIFSELDTVYFVALAIVSAIYYFAEYQSETIEAVASVSACVLAILLAQVTYWKSAHGAAILVGGIGFFLLIRIIHYHVLETMSRLRDKQERRYKDKAYQFYDDLSPKKRDEFLEQAYAWGKNSKSSLIRNIGPHSRDWDKKNLFAEYAKAKGIKI